MGRIPLPAASSGRERDRVLRCNASPPLLVPAFRLTADRRAGTAAAAGFPLRPLALNAGEAGTHEVVAADAGAVQTPGRYSCVRAARSC